MEINFRPLKICFITVLNVILFMYRQETFVLILILHFFSLSYACIRRLKAILSFHTTFVNKLADAQTHTFVYLFCHSPKLRHRVIIRIPDSAPACTSISPSLHLWSLLFFKLLFYYNAQRSICFISVETFIYLLEIKLPAIRNMLTCG